MSDRAEHSRASVTAGKGRPRIICHMMASLDGRIVTDGWPLSPEGWRQYEQVHASYAPDAWICGRVTMEEHFAQGVRSDVEIAQRHTGAQRKDFRAPGDRESFAFAVDSSGRLAWDTNDIDGDHVVAVLSQQVSDEYLAFLRGRGVSYILAGDREVDLSTAVQKIGREYGVGTLMLEGGGKINGGFLREGLIDELSLLVSPVADCRMGTPALFDLEDGEVTPFRLSLQSVERRADDMVWVRYSIAPTASPPAEG